MIELLLAVAAFAQVPEKVPSVFCEGALQVSERTDSCEANTNYLQAAKACLHKLDALETALGSEAHSIAQSAAASQQGKAAGGASTYAFTSEALTYLREVAGVAKAQVVEYKKYVAPPADENEEIEDPGQLMARSPCFLNTEHGLEKTEQEFADKIARYHTRLAQARAFEKTLEGKSADFGSMNGRISGRKTERLPGEVPKSRDSDVSGKLEPPR